MIWHIGLAKPSSWSRRSAGVVDGAGSCCDGDQPVLDSSGSCCTRSLDAAGTCSGTALAVDFTGQPCNGALDAGGLCCPQPLVVDDFGVCAGDSTSGVLVLAFNVLTTSTEGEMVIPKASLCKCPES